MIWQVTINFIPGLFVCVIAVYFMFKNTKDKFKIIEDKITIIWNYLIKRAETEFIIKGLGTINSPYIITPEVRSWYDPIADDLHKFYTKVGVTLTNTELFAMVSKEFGDWITTNICMPRNLEAGSCIIAAIAVAKEAA